MSFSLKTAEVLDLTPQLAMQFREMEPSPTERPLNKARVKHLKEKFENGKLVTCHWSRAKFDGRLIRMNGQHSSTALCELNGSFPAGGKAHMDTYEAPTKEDLADLFQQFDDRKSSRTPGDVAQAYQMLYEEVRGVKPEAAKLAIDGYAWQRRIVEGVGTSEYVGDGVYALFRQADLHPFVRWVGDIFSVKTKELRRIQVVAAMHDTFVRNEEAARSFWGDVSRGGIQYEETAPATVLDRWLVRAVEKEEKARLKLKPADFYQGCIYAWNAFREEKPLKDIKSDHKKGFLTVIS
jgi:hypothetical protein